MLQIKLSKQIRKDLKHAKKQHCDLNLFEFIVRKIAKGEKLDPKYRDHKLNGDLKGYRACHVQNDWVLVYRIYKNELILYLYRYGSHNYTRIKD